MNKVIIVSKTHLDLGFTDFASNILDKYTNDFIPNSVKIAQSVNKDEKKFVWTVGAWLLKTVLNRGTESQKKELYEACLRGDIVAHAMPFTTHTELMDKDLAEYGLSIIKDLDKAFNRTTVAAKMTDVPGHTAALVPILAQAGIKLLHIGVNGASAMPKLPNCFLWKKDGAEIIVIYAGSYGGEFKSGLIGDILYFDHSLDNHGPRGEVGVLRNFDSIKAKYLGYEVVAGTLDDYAELLWEKKDLLPVVTSEIGDSWIHGGATDPYKIGAMRELLRLKDEWIEKGEMIKGSEEYNGLMDGLLCVCEHTWGLDMKIKFGDYKNYLRKDFDEARAKDIRIKRGGIYALKCFKKYALNGKKGVYSTMEEGWNEQRAYLNAAMDSLSDKHKKQAEERLKKLKPQAFLQQLENVYQPDTTLKSGDIAMEINGRGGIGFLQYKGATLIQKNSKSILEYHSYGKADYDFWRKHYMRDFNKNWVWSLADFCRPFISKIDKKYRQGRFGYKLESASVERKKDGFKILANLIIEEYCFKNLGASLRAQICYTVENNKLSFDVIWCGKPANRLTEAIYLRVYPKAEKSDIFYKKINSLVSPYDVCENGNRNISAVESVEFKSEATAWAIVNRHAPLVSLGKGKILEFDNKYEDIAADGISFVLYDNVWGTNFPLWYDDNALFHFEINL